MCRTTTLWCLIGYLLEVCNILWKHLQPLGSGKQGTVSTVKEDILLHCSEIVVVVLHLNVVLYCTLVLFYCHQLTLIFWRRWRKTHPVFNLLTVRRRWKTWSRNCAGRGCWVISLLSLDTKLWSKYWITWRLLGL